MTAAHKVLIVEARFYEDIADELLMGVLNTLAELNVIYDKINVPGALEIPAAIKMAMGSKENYAGYIALGCVIRGETKHFDIVACESARGLMDLSVEHGVAIANAILTVENEDQAWQRAKTDQINIGARAARACVDMINIRKRFA